MTNLNDLIERLERATGPSRELDALILGATHYPNSEYFSLSLSDGDRPADAYNSRTVLCVRHSKDHAHYRNPPHYTQSIDAAMTLKPEGWHVLNLRHMSETEWFAGLAKKFPDSEFANEAEAKAQTPAIALCIASLKALASIRSGVE